MRGVLAKMRLKRGEAHRLRETISRPLPAHLVPVPSQSPLASHPVELSEKHQVQVQVQVQVPPRSVTASPSPSVISNPINKYDCGSELESVSSIPIDKYVCDVESEARPRHDANDPLNWPRWRKDLNLVSLLLMVGLVGGMKTVFVSSAASLSSRWHVSPTAVAALTAAPLIISALTALVSSSVARFRGKRPVYLASAASMFIGTVWNLSAGDSYRSCMGARVFQGLGWGAFDVLVIASIQETYKEHERSFPVALYNVVAVTTTWGSPILGGFASTSNGAGGFTNQFRIISGFYVLAALLVVFGVPETTFDRSRAISSSSSSAMVVAAVVEEPLPAPALQARPVGRFLDGFSRARVAAYLDKLEPCPYKAPFSLAVALEACRALVAPTTSLLVILTLIPFGSLWGLTTSVAVTVAPSWSAKHAGSIGALMTGPWIMASLCVVALCFFLGTARDEQRQRQQQQQQQPARRVCWSPILMTGSLVVLTGLLSYGLGMHTSSASGHPRHEHEHEHQQKNVSFALVSLELGILAAGTYMLDTAVRPLIARSVLSTYLGPRAARQRTNDMHGGVVVVRNTVAGIFVLVMPTALESLGSVAVGLATTQVLLTICLVVLWRFAQDSVWRADGVVLGPVDLQQSASFFETD